MRKLRVFLPALALAGAWSALGAEVVLWQPATSTSPSRLPAHSTGVRRPTFA